MTEYEQLQLPLEDAPMPAEWTVTISKGPLHEEEIERTHHAKTPEAALAFVEALRDTYHAREDVAWQAEEVNAEGALYGLAPGGTVYAIRCTPPLPDTV